MKTHRYQKAHMDSDGEKRKDKGQERGVVVGKAGDAKTKAHPHTLRQLSKPTPARSLWSQDHRVEPQPRQLARIPRPLRHPLVERPSQAQKALAHPVLGARANVALAVLPGPCPREQHSDLCRFGEQPAVRVQTLLWQMLAHLQGHDPIARL